MNSNSAGIGKDQNQARESIAYIRQMLGELRGVASTQGAEMLRYLIEMAYIEAGDIQMGKRPMSGFNGEGNHAAGVPVESPGEVKF